MSNVDNTMGQKPMEFRRRPLGVTAVWYMGGEGSGLEVAQWIRRNNGTAAFFASVPAWVHESGAAGYPEQSEKIAMETVSGFTYVEPGAWVAKDSNGQFHIYTSETFEREFIQTSFPENTVGLEAFQNMADGRRRLSEYEVVSKSVNDSYESWDI